MWHQSVFLLLTVAWLPQGRAQTCIQMYKDAFKGKAKVKPAEVGKLYMNYCKKNMRVGSAKSMDELCQPIVKKVEDKMVWVPDDVEVVPELVCKTLDQIKAEYPEHAKLMAESEEARKRHEDVEEAEKKKIAANAKAFGASVAQDLAEVLKKAGETASKELEERMQKHVEVLGGEMDERKKKMISKILESVTLGIRGLETKTKQKSEESVKEWLVYEARAVAKARQEDNKKKEL
mmetsp:Transcript_11828/g.19417  ORF Transcript_11828/g.19417 Transcript_11828/m.19417 type:complete len:234 (-) Transcript_11828:96-797(-)|eukprot:CAMPEP_0169108054 /NCGR_PEP_ID=MMETSP1015-20121227/25218_1 /TAXON_ID=342587 /ORGANISM="Karlodinium micrum, Strain CCMP2283" /LENGTH=233 /DNA_ID=CAMNT_0009169641 /DNA_START=28 /DNA_END=729 /DNA_ORIENTATION=+